MPYLLFYFFHYKALDNIANFDIVEFIDLHTAFIVCCYFSYIVLETSERSKLALVDNNVITQNSNLATSLDLTFLNIAATYCTNFGDLVCLSYLSMADYMFL